MMEPERDERLVRDVFTRTRVAPRPDLAQRVRRRVADERRRRRPDGGWPLMVAGAALTLVMVVGLLVDDGVVQWPSWGAPTPPPQTTTMGSGGPWLPAFVLPPAGGGPGPLRFVDWTGRTRGSLVPPAGAAVEASADGALLAVRDPEGSGAEVLDAGGRRVARLAEFGAWSADGVPEACDLVDGEGGPRIATTDLRDPTRPRGATVTVSGLGGPGDGWTMARCAAGSGRLVALHEAGPSLVDETAVIALRTGVVIARVTYDDGPLPVAPVVSPDARYLAENDPVRRAASIRDLGTGEVVGHVTGLVTGFSGDGALVVTDSELDAPTQSSRVAIVDWRWGWTEWAGAGHGVPLAVRPGGQQVVLAVTTDPAAAPHALLVDGSHALDLDAAPSAPASRGA